MEDGEQKSAWITWVLGGLSATFLVGGLFLLESDPKLEPVEGQSRIKSRFVAISYLETSEKHAGANQSAGFIDYRSIFDSAIPS